MQGTPIHQLDPVVLRLDHIGRGLDHFNPGRDEIALGLDDIVLAVHPKRDEQEPGLVVVRIVGIDDGHLPFVAIEQPAQPVDNHGAGSAGSENQ